MSRKLFYKYNEFTGAFERVYPSRINRVWSIVKNSFEAIAIAVILIGGLYYLIDFPKERLLREENRRLKQHLDQLDDRLTEALDVMENITERDNNFYRVMMQADPMSINRRTSGHERRNITGFADAELVEDVTEKMDLLDRLIYSQINSFDSLRTYASQQKERLASIPSIQPISHDDMKQMASGYGTRVDPVYGTIKFHEGMDFASATGTPVYATGDGTVTTAGWHSGYGNMIELNHGYNYTTRYAHLSKIIVQPGQRVKRGDKIGEVGNTGKSTGSHLHYEVRYNGQPRNPVNYYFQDLTPEQYAEMVRTAEAAAHVMD